MQKAGRMKKELQMLSTAPPHGVSCWPSDDRLNKWEAKLVGATDTPYKGGVFKLEIDIPVRYIIYIYYIYIYNYLFICVNNEV